MQLKFRYGDEEFDCEICYLSTVKGKVAIHVHPDGSVQVDAPPSTSTASIKKAIQKRARRYNTMGTLAMIIGGIALSSVLVGIRFLVRS